MLNSVLLARVCPALPTGFEPLFGGERLAAGLTNGSDTRAGIEQEIAAQTVSPPETQRYQECWLAQVLPGPNWWYRPVIAGGVIRNAGRA